MARACLDAVVHGRRLVADLREIRAGWSDGVRARSDSAVWPLMDLVLRQPVVTTAIVQRELGVSHTNATRALDRLVAAGALETFGGRRRSVLWRAPQVLGALDAFAAGVGRRSAEVPAAPEPPTDDESR